MCRDRAPTAASGQAPRTSHGAAPAAHASHLKAAPHEASCTGSAQASPGQFQRPDAQPQKQAHGLQAVRRQDVSRPLAPQLLWLIPTDHWRGPAALQQKLSGRLKGERGEPLSLYDKLRHKEMRQDASRLCQAFRFIVSKDFWST